MWKTYLTTLTTFLTLKATTALPITDTPANFEADRAFPYPWPYTGEWHEYLVHYHAGDSETVSLGPLQLHLYLMHLISGKYTNIP